MWKTYFVATQTEATHQTLAALSSPLKNQNGVTLWCLENNQQIKAHADLLNFWKDLDRHQFKILTWPDQEEPSLNLLQAIFENQKAIVLTSIQNLGLSVPAWDFLKSNRLNLETKEKINLFELSENLIALGLERTEEVWQENNFSIKGSLISIYQNQTIYRFNLWEDKIEEINQINPHDLDQVKKINQFFVWPQKINRKEQLDLHLPKNCLLITNEKYSSEIKELTNDKIIFDPFKNKADLNFVTENLNFQHLDTKQRLESLKEEKIQKIIWFTKNKNLAKEFLTEEKIKPNFIQLEKSAPWPASFYLAAEKTILVNDNLFFLENTEKNLSQQRQAFSLDFQLGDLVVHRDHGIARLEKTTTLEVDGLNKEYFVLKYAQNDTLFVPFDLADKLEKYIGPSNPKINRLSKDNAWPQTLRKIKQETWELANQLLIIEATRKLHQTPKIKKSTLTEAVAKNFPYQETASQKQAIEDVFADLDSPLPADRLICGDVGFGKTEIAIRAAAATVDNNFQVALLCPTTILAQQHYDLFVKRLESLGVKIALLSRWQNEKEIKKNIQEIKEGKVDIIIGTHRILSKDILIPKLQLLIIDEEQNFGVEDKEKLKKHKSQINVLTLSATPIPRTLNMALSLIKDISLITDPINNRQDIITEVKMLSDEVIKTAIATELKRKGQVYFLHNRVETISLAYKKIQKLFPKNKIALAHGQLDDKTLATTMHAFDSGEIDILVCSTIIANGLDIANANTLIVTEADRFGLSQLHQLRGRIGRSKQQAYAYFLYSKDRLSALSQQRLAHLKLASSLGDGFKIANKDLELRGVGQILGKAQSGKVKSIGLGLYQQLISETVAELKGQILKPWKDLEIKLKIPTELPRNFFSNPEEKIFFFQKISRLKNLEDLKKAKNKSSDHHYQNILFLQKLKILSQDTNIISIQEYSQNQKEFLSLNFLGKIDLKKIVELQKQNSHWRYNEQQIKIEKNQLGANLQQALEDLIILLKR
ncbi:DEAD/DEAH box helicase [Candidatus Nomurabacteria bacterium]|nr:DEAD/DEAH box helicase [Candidatus Nomurabacteria bacterium]